jgi:Na+/H+ antiporter NhaD/arsenite permease-like protein
MVAPLIIRICRQMEMNFVQPVILLVFVANSAGLLTLVGDPATFIVGSAIGLSFTGYLALLTPGGVLALVAVVMLLPLIFRPVWQARAPSEIAYTPHRIERPVVLLAYLAVLAVMIMLFVVGEDLPNPIGPPGVALIGAGMALLIAYWTGVDRVADILRDVDWETLLFFVCIFVLVGALTKTGVIETLGSAMGNLFGRNVIVASFLLLGGIGVLSSVIPNIPLLVAMVLLVKQYAVGAGLATPAAIEAGYGQMPAEVLPLFFAMCFGGTLGGNASLLGASSNIVAGGICAQNGERISFMAFLRYGMTVDAIQLAVSATSLWVRFL